MLVSTDDRLLFQCYSSNFHILLINIKNVSTAHLIRLQFSNVLTCGSPRRNMALDLTKIIISSRLMWMHVSQTELIPLAPEHLNLPKVTTKTSIATNS